MRTGPPRKIVSVDTIPMTSTKSGDHTLLRAKSLPLKKALPWKQAGLHSNLDHFLQRSLAWNSSRRLNWIRLVSYKNVITNFAATNVVDMSSGTARGPERHASARLSSFSTIYLDGNCICGFILVKSWKGITRRSWLTLGIRVDSIIRATLWMQNLSYLWPTIC